MEKYSKFCIIREIWCSKKEEKKKKEREIAIGLRICRVVLRFHKNIILYCDSRKINNKKINESLRCWPINRVAFCLSVCKVLVSG